MSYNDKEWKPYNIDIENSIKKYLNEDFTKNYLKDRLNNFTITFKTFQKPNNNAPKSIKGDYDLSIHGNKIVLVDKNDGTTVEAKCHPEDGFDIGIGITESFKKLNEKREEIQKQKEEEEKKIKVGDWVEVIDYEISYPIYSTFFFENNLEDLGRNFRYGCYLNNGDKLQVAHIEGDKFVLKRKEKIGGYGFQDCVYLMNIHGLKKVMKTN